MNVASPDGNRPMRARSNRLAFLAVLAFLAAFWTLVALAVYELVAWL